MLASIPARKFFSLRYTQRLWTMASIVRARFLWKATSSTPRAFACFRLSRLAYPPSLTVCRGAVPWRAMWRSPPQLEKSRCADVPSSANGDSNAKR